MPRLLLWPTMLLGILYARLSHFSQGDGVMTRKIHFPLAVRLATIGGALLLAMFVYTGCSDSQAGSGRNADLEPDDEEPNPRPLLRFPLGWRQ